MQNSFIICHKSIILYISFDKLTYKSLNELESCVYMKGKTTNGISVYLRTLKAKYNKAINLDIAEYEFYLFR